MIPKEQIINDARKALIADFSTHPSPEQNEIRSRTVIYVTSDITESYLVEFEFSDGIWNPESINGKRI